RASLHLALSVHDFRLHAKEWTRCRAGLEFGCARQWCDKDAASLGLPPSVDDWATIFADDVVVPFPGFRIDRLTHSAKKAQRFARGFLYRIIAALHQGADRGRCSIDSGLPCACRTPPRSEKWSESSARPRTSLRWHRWIAGHRQCSCDR